MGGHVESASKMQCLLMSMQMVQVLLQLNELWVLTQVGNRPCICSCGTWTLDCHRGGVGWSAGGRLTRGLHRCRVDPGSLQIGIDL